MEFTIGQNASLPVLKMQVVKDGTQNFDSMMAFIERSSIFFTMVNTENGIPKVYTKSAGFVEKLEMDPNATPEYYVYYRFTTQDTSRIGRYEGQFMFINDTGTLVLPIRESLFINIVESYIANDLPYSDCYNLNFSCCVTPFPTPEPTQTPFPVLSQTQTPRPTVTPTPTNTPTFTPTNTPTFTPTVTPTQTPTNTVTSTNTPTNTITPTNTQTPTVTIGLTPTATPSNTATNTVTPTPTPTIDILINPIITENDEYIDVGGNFYLMFVDPPPQELINPIITENGEYIDVGGNFYLMFVDQPPQELINPLIVGNDEYLLIGDEEYLEFVDPI